MRHRERGSGREGQGVREEGTGRHRDSLHNWSRGTGMDSLHNWSRGTGMDSLHNWSRGTGIHSTIGAEVFKFFFIVYYSLHNFTSITLLFTTLFTRIHYTISLLFSLKTIKLIFFYILREIIIYPLQKKKTHLNNTTTRYII